MIRWKTKSLIGLDIDGERFASVLAIRQQRGTNPATLSIV
jgi:hypothetical protein